jgi:hypothetical protein
MGFNKKYFNIEKIKSFAKTNTYESFKIYLLSSDGCVFSDAESFYIWQVFSNGDEEKRQRLYQFLVNKS